MSRLEALRAVELGQLHDIERIRAGLMSLADELHQRSELLGNCMQRLGENATTQQSQREGAAAALQALKEKDLKQDEAIARLEQEHSRTMGLLATFEKELKETWESNKRETFEGMSGAHATQESIA